MTEGWPGARHLWIRIVVLVLGCAAMVAAQTREEAYQGSVPFSHRLHVPAEWLTRDQVNDASNPDEVKNRARLLGETPRDCRGCHGYEAGQEREPQQVCARCHYLPDTLRVTAQPGFAAGLAPLRRKPEVTPFRHQEHLAIGCRACHGTTGTQVPARLPVPEGTALCFRCHRDRDPTDPRMAGWAPDGHKEWLRDPNAPDGGHGRFLARLNQDPSMGPKGFEPFAHRDHIVPANRTGADDCARCHLGIKDADARTLAAARIGTAALPGCVSYCHRTETDILEFDLVAREQPSLSAAAFHHKDHLRQDSRYPALTCADCHEYRPAPGTDYPLRPIYAGAKAYQGCADCHTRMRIDGQPTLLDHGEVQNCLPCHALGQGRMASNRPQAAAPRPRPAYFLVDEQTHPFLTGNRSQECFAVCHRAEFERLPSRLRGRRFDHQTHLPPTRRAEDCARCHQGIRQTGADLAQSYDSLPPTAAGTLAQPDPKVCGGCHQGATLVAEAEPIATTGARPAPLRFPHDRHLGPRTRALGAEQVPAMDCLTCHVPGQTAGADIGTTAAARTCQPCHRHEGWQAEITAGKDRVYVGTCVACHERFGNAVPADDAVVRVPTQRIEGVRSQQFHPRAKSCDGCHVGAESLLRREPSHLSAQLQRVHAAEGATPDPQKTDCLRCHWDLNIKNATDGAASNPKFATFLRTVSRASATPRLQIRSFFGGDLADYPGREPQK